MKYGRLKLDLDIDMGNVDLIKKVIENEKLPADCSVIMRTLKIKVIPKENQFAMDSSVIQLEVDNIPDYDAPAKKSYFDIDYYMPLELADCNLDKIIIKGWGKVVVDYGY